MTAPTPDEPPASRVLIDCPFVQTDLPRLRVLVDRYADREGLPAPRRGDFIVAVDAVASNAIEHAGGTGTLILQRADGHLACHIHDSGPGFTTDVVPPPAPGNGDLSAGRGLWIASLITDHLSITSDTNGSVVSLTMRLPHRSDPV
ncbi:ATP-binding protein [Streptomyces aureocirculatus]|uniref:ATP-binding protein n=1 Tax=Streptomyces aureocirculatus TaxID=67275 RepID=UPI0004C852C8|nr:ATP-binding protein [Streptomyces aureocirculatus]